MKTKIEIEIENELLHDTKKLVDEIRFVSVSHFIEVATLEAVNSMEFRGAGWVPPMAPRRKKNRAKKIPAKKK